MRALLAVLGLAALAGCATPTDLESATAPEIVLPSETTGTAELALAGTYWMPTSLGMSTASGNVSFPLNASDLDVTIKLRVGTRAAGVEAPASSAMVMAKLVDATSKTVAEAMIMPPEREATITTQNAAAGLCQLVLETHGGSDGSANGDYVAYDITAKPRQA